MSNLSKKTLKFVGQFEKSILSVRMTNVWRKNTWSVHGRFSLIQI